MKHDSKDEAMYVRAAERAMDLAADYFVPVIKADAKFYVRKNDRNWDVCDRQTGNVVEGGFFQRDSAEDCAAEWNTNC